MSLITTRIRLLSQILDPESELLREEELEELERRLLEEKGLTFEEAEEELERKERKELMTPSRRVKEFREKKKEELGTSELRNLMEDSFGEYRSGKSKQKIIDYISWLYSRSIGQLVSMFIDRIDKLEKEIVRTINTDYELGVPISQQDLRMEMMLFSTEDFDFALKNLLDDKRINVYKTDDGKFVFLPSHVVTLPRKILPQQLQQLTADVLAEIRQILTPGIPPVTFGHLVKSFPSISSDTLKFVLDSLERQNQIRSVRDETFGITTYVPYEVKPEMLPGYRKQLREKERAQEQKLEEITELHEREVVRVTKERAVFYALKSLNNKKIYPTLEDLAKELGIVPGFIKEILDTLIQQNRVETFTDTEGIVRYRAKYVIGGPLKKLLEKRLQQGVEEEEHLTFVPLETVEHLI